MFRFHLLLYLEVWEEEGQTYFPMTSCLPHFLGCLFCLPGSGGVRPHWSPKDRRAALGPAGPVWAGLGPPLLPLQLLLLTCILSGGLWWGSDAH